MGSRRYLLRKCLQAVVTLWFVLTFNFFLFRVLPGDPVGMLARSEKLTPDDVARLQHDQGLDLPMLQQYVVYMKNVVTGNLGESLRTGFPVRELIGARMWPTVLLVGLGTILASWLGVLIGIRGGWRRGSRFDTTSQYSSLILYAMPEFWLGMLLLMLFSGVLHWFPTGGRISTDASELSTVGYWADVARHLFLPFLTLTLAYLGEFYLVMRSSLLDVLGEDYITTARAKGVAERLVLNRHAVRNALLPTVTLVALSFGYVIGGAITVEVVFSYQGVGLLTYSSILGKDYWVLQALFLFFSIAVIVFNLASDLVYAYLDPRVRNA